MVLRMRCILLGLLLVFLQPSSRTIPQESEVAQSSAPQLTSEQIASLQSAAASGDAAAQFKLALAYEKGDGVPQDPGKAFEWCKKSADQGNADGETELGVMYRLGEGVGEDRQLAVQWYEKASRQGNARAMFNLGAAYYNGDGVPIDDSLSYAWFVLAKEAGSPEAVAAVARGDAELPALRITSAYKRLAELCEDGKYVPENQTESASWWLKAAKRGDHEAQLGIANKLINGQGVARDFAQARYWCERVAKGGLYGESSGDYCLGYIYQHGLGVPSDMKAARKWYELAGALATAASIRALAQMQEAGEGAKPDPVGAARSYMQLAMFKNDDSAIQQVIRLKNEMSTMQWNDLRSSKSWPFAPRRVHVAAYLQADPRFFTQREAMILAQIDEAGEGAKIDLIDAAVFYAALAMDNDADMLQQVVRLKSKMSAEDWGEVEKRLRHYQFDPAKLRTIMEASAAH